MGNNRRSPIKQGLLVAALTLILTIVFSLLSQNLISRINSIIVSSIFLFIIILVGIVSDVIGTAATATSEVPFHSKAANKVKGAYHAISLARNADRVANFCNDVVGDIVGTLSGALGIALVAQILANDPSMSQTILSMLVTGLVAATTVGGKSYGKRFAIEKSDKIIFAVGKLLSWVETILRINLINNNNQKQNGKNKKKVGKI